MSERPSKKVSLRLKIGSNELEISGEYNDVMDIVDKLLPYLISKESVKGSEQVMMEEVKREGEMLVISDLPPSIHIKKGEPLTEILTKLFDTKWGHKPRPLKEIIEALNSYGLYYPKSTIAVTLNRLSQRGVVRRVRTKEKYYLYVSAKPLGGGDDE